MTLHTEPSQRRNAMDNQLANLFYTAFQRRISAPQNRSKIATEQYQQPDQILSTQRLQHSP